MFPLRGNCKKKTDKTKYKFWKQQLLRGLRLYIHLKLDVNSGIIPPKIFPCGAIYKNSRFFLLWTSCLRFILVFWLPNTCCQFLAEKISDFVTVSENDFENFRRTILTFQILRDGQNLNSTIAENWNGRLWSVGEKI